MVLGSIIQERCKLMSELNISHKTPKDTIGVVKVPLFGHTSAR